MERYHGVAHAPSAKEPNSPKRRLAKSTVQAPQPACCPSVTPSQLALQRLDDPTLPAETAAGLVVEDADSVGPHQLRKTEFMDGLEAALRSGLTSSLEGSGFTADNCPWLDYYLKLYRARDAARVNAAALRYGANAPSASELIGLIVARVQERVARWRRTGDVGEVPDSEPAPSPDEAVQRFEHAAAGLSGSQPQAIQRRLIAGTPIPEPTLGRMESAFGTGFNHVRVHTNTEAGALAHGLRAKAFAIGQDVAFAPGEYAPGTVRGDLILAHELAHTLQQREASSWSNSGESPELEGEAAAMAAAAVLGGQATAIARRTGLQLRRCTDEITASAEASLRVEIVELLARPDDNADQIIGKIDDLKDNAPDALMKTNYFNDLGSVGTLARYPGGRKVLTRVVEALKDGDLLTKVHGDDIQKVLDAYAAPAATPTSDEQTAIDTLNQAINAEDPARLGLYKQEPLPLLLPVRLYEPGREEVGGVYYNPYMPKKAVKGHGHAGKTVAEGRSGTVEGTKFQHLHVGYIQLGPLALSSAEYARTAMYHEFLHYSLQRDRHLGKVTDADLQQIESTMRAGKSTAGADEEIEIISIQMEAHFDVLNDKDAEGLLAYLADNMGTTHATQTFINRGVRRIEAFVKGNDKRIARMLKLIGQLSKTEAKALEPIRAAVAALAPKPKKKKGK